MTETVRKACLEVAKHDLDRVVKRGAPYASAFGYERTLSKEQKQILAESQLVLNVIHENNVEACMARVRRYE